MLPTSDTIAAIATARGRAALAIVRASGPRAIEIVARCFRGVDLQKVPSHTAHVGYLEGPGETQLDHVVVAVFRAPRSSTGEDVAEVSCHGGDLAPQLVLQALLAQGARLAQPGEFTQRAFLNGKLDLAQAEAVADLIHANSTLAHRTSLQQLQGRYSALLKSLREELLDVAALVELELDFSDEDVQFADRPRLESILRRAEELLSELLGSYQFGAAVRDGVRVAIAGRPNAGKSTLLNKLVGQDRAIVSATPGTTRDEIEAEAEIEGLRFRFVDTAGLRETTDEIEAEGVRRARARVETSDFLIYLYDLTVGLHDEEIRLLTELLATQNKPGVLIGNKADLVNGIPPCSLPFPHVMLSASTQDAAHPDFRRLIDLLLEETAGRLGDTDTSRIVTNVRHRQHLALALDAVRSAQSALDAGVSGDVLALDLRTALHELGAITGEITNEDVLDGIFSRFCIGK